MRLHEPTNGWIWDSFHFKTCNGTGGSPNFFSFPLWRAENGGANGTAITDKRAGFGGVIKGSAVAVVLNIWVRVRVCFLEAWQPLK